MTSCAHAAWLHVCPEAFAKTEKLAARITQPDGTQMGIAANGQPTLPGCRSVFLPVEAEQIEAIYPLAGNAAVGHTILLEGISQDRRFVIGGVTLLPAKPAPVPVPMPLHVNLLNAMQVRSFGVEERVRTSLDNGRLHVECAAGDKPAGVILTAPLALPQADVVLRASMAGVGSFDWQVADAVRAAAESGLEMGSFTLGKESSQVSMNLPSRLERTNWKHFTIACPAQKASLRLYALELAPSAPRATLRSSWVWNTQDWLQGGDVLLAWAHRQHVGELFVTVPLEEGRVRDVAALGTFVRQANAQGIAIWAVDGDPHMVLPEEQTVTLQRARAYAAYNEAVDAPARLRGIQFDIEPYLLPGYDMNRAAWEGRYLELARMLRKVAADMQLEFVVPYWWADRENVLHGLSLTADSLAVMDYRTDAQEIYRFAVPFLDWATTHRKQVRIALEAGPVESETQRRYVRADEGGGELWLLRVEGMAVLVLLKEARPHPDAQVFRFAGQQAYDGSATSFHADLQKLEKLLPSLEKDFAAWKSFGGMALHEFK